MDHTAWVGELGEVTGAAGDDVVQEPGLVVAAAVDLGGVGSTGDLNVVRRTADPLPQPHQNYRGKARQRKHVSERHRPWEPDYESFGAHGAAQRDAVGGLAIGATGAVFSGLVGAGRRVELSAGHAHPEQRCRVLTVGDEQRGALTGGLAEVEPADGLISQVLRAEPVVADEPLPGHIRGVHIRGGEHAVDLTDAIITVVGDRGVVATHGGVDPFKLHDVKALLGVGDLR